MPGGIHMIHILRARLRSWVRLKAWVWLLITQLDNRMSAGRGTSPLLLVLRYRWRLARENMIRPGACIRIKASPSGNLRRGRFPVTPNADAAPGYHAGTFLLSREPDHNIALILRHSFMTYLSMRHRDWSPDAVTVVNTQKTYPKAKQPARDSRFLQDVYSLLPNVHSLSYFSSAGEYRLEHAVKVKVRNFWELMTARAELFEDFRDSVLRGMSLTPAGPTTSVRRVTVVSRRVSEGVLPTARRMDNEDELREAVQARLPAARVSTVALEDLDLPAQMDVINQTDLLIGMHGAGLGYSMMLPPNAAVLEIFPWHFRQPHCFYTFYGVCAARGLHYRRVLCPPWSGGASEAYAEALKNLRAEDVPDIPELNADVISRLPEKDYWRVPLRSVLRKVDVLARRIAQRRSVNDGAEKRT